MADENELYAEWQNTAPDARQDIETRLAATVRRHAQAIVQQRLNEPQLEGLVQDIVTAAMTQLRKFRGESKFSTWVQSIAENNANEYLRSKIRERERGEYIVVGENGDEDDDHERSESVIPGVAAKQESQVI